MHTLNLRFKKDFEMDNGCGPDLTLGHTYEVGAVQTTADGDTVLIITTNSGNHHGFYTGNDEDLVLTEHFDIEGDLEATLKYVAEQQQLALLDKPATDLVEGEQFGTDAEGNPTLKVSEDG